MDKLLKRMNDMDPEEIDKIRGFLKEKKKDKEEPDMGWMYKSSKPEAEEYLLGRRIDKHIDDEEEKEAEQMKDAPGALFKDAMARRADLDMQAKMREDPLYAIRQKEEDAKRRLLENPIKMKQLQDMVEKNKAKKKKKDKKKKKHKRKVSSDSGNSDSDDELMQKYLAILSAKQGKKATQGQSSEDDSSTHHKHKKSHKHKKHKSKRRESSSERDSPEKDRTRPVERQKVVPKGYGLIVPGGSRSPAKRSRSRSPKRHRSRSPVRKQKEKTPPKYKPEPRKKMTEDEREARRREMMSDAQDRDKQREKNVKRYREDAKKEEEDLDKLRGGSDKFINSMLTKHASSSSVEDRIKRNKYHIQRTKADLS